MTHNILHYILAIAGWILYNLLILNVSKDKLDDVNKHFHWKSYKRKHWDNWAFTLLLSPFLVYYMSDIVTLFSEWLGRDIPKLEIYYLGCGVLTEVINYLLAKIVKLRNA